MSNLENGGYTSGVAGQSLSKVGNATRVRLNIPIKVYANTKYSFKLQTSKLLRYNILEVGEDNIIKKVTSVTNTNSTTLTTTSETAYVTFLFLWQTTTQNITIDDLQDCKIQFEIGVETYYVEHQQTDYILNIQQEMLEGDYFVKEADGWKEVHGWNKKVFDGKENIGLTNNSNSFAYIASDILKTTNTLSLPEIFSNCYKSSSWNDRNNNNTPNTISVYSITIGFDKGNLLTVEEFKQMLADKYNAGNPVYAFYKSATPTKIPCTEEQSKVLDELNSLTMEFGVNNIITAEDIALLQMTLVDSQLNDVIEASIPVIEEPCEVPYAVLDTILAIDSDGATQEDVQTAFGSTSKSAEFFEAAKNGRSIVFKDSGIHDNENYNRKFTVTSQHYITGSEPTFETATVSISGIIEVNYEFGALAESYLVDIKILTTDGSTVSHAYINQMSVEDMMDAIISIYGNITDPNGIENNTDLNDIKNDGVYQFNNSDTGILNVPGNAKRGTLYVSRTAANDGVTQLLLVPTWKEGSSQNDQGVYFRSYGLPADSSTSTTDPIWTDWVNLTNTSGAVESANKLTTARNITITGDETSDPVAFDGTKDISLSVTRKGASVGQSGSTTTNPWYKVADIDIVINNQDRHLIMMVYGTYNVSYALGILRAKIRTNTMSNSTPVTAELTWILKEESIDTSKFRLCYKVDEESNMCTAELWVCIDSYGYLGYNFDVISEGSRTSRGPESASITWSMYNTWSAGSQANYPSEEDGYSSVVSKLALISNAVDNANKLTTPRNINGVAFDGSANINITANPTSNQLTNEDLNNVKTPGFYFGVGNNSITNKPSNADWFGLLVSKVAGGYTLQEIHIGTSSSVKYYNRLFNNSTWTNWQEMKYTDTTYSVMKGATSSAAGTSGLVPAPAAGKQASFLRGDGTWVVPTNTTYSVATTSTNGLMSSTMVTKLNGIATGATANSASTTTPKANGTAAVGTDTKFARGDHVHPAQTTITGNAGSATKLQTARTINGVAFNGTANINTFDSSYKVPGCYRMKSTSNPSLNMPGGNNFIPLEAFPMYSELGTNPLFTLNSDGTITVNKTCMLDFRGTWSVYGSGNTSNKIYSNITYYDSAMQGWMPLYSSPLVPTSTMEMTSYDADFGPGQMGMVMAGTKIRASLDSTNDTSGAVFVGQINGYSLFINVIYVKG